MRESAGIATVCIDIDEAPERSVFISLSQVDANSQDYQLPPVTNLEFTSGQSQICVNITIINDDIVEGLENYLFEVSSSDPRVDIINSRTTLIIEDYDCKDACFITTLFALIFYCCCFL